MDRTPFKVAITGDTGFDVYTEYVKHYESDDRRIQNVDAAYDVYVPSAAAFTTAVFKATLNDPSIVVEHLQPKVAYEARQEENEVSTLQKLLVELDRLPDHRTKANDVLRVRRTRPIVDNDPPIAPDVFDELVNEQGESLDKNCRYDLLIIHDGAGSWRKYPTSDPKGNTLTLVKEILSNEPESPNLRIIVNLNHDLLDVARDSNGQLVFPEGKQLFWHELNKHADKVCVICSVNMLRREGAAISRRVSWEQTVEDIATDLLLLDKLKMLSSFKHFIIRIGAVGALHIISEGRKRTADLVFAPLAKAGIYRDPSEDGTIEGQNTLMAAALSKMVVDAWREKTKISRSSFVDALRSGLLACMRAFDNGYEITWCNDGRACSFEAGRNLVQVLMTAPAPDASPRDAIFNGYQRARKKSDQIMGCASVPDEILDRPPGSLGRNFDWELLRNAINRTSEIPSPCAQLGAADGPGERRRISRINTGIGIVLFGQKRILNQTWDEKDPRDEQILRILNRPELATSPEEVRDHLTLPLGKLPVLPPASQHVFGRRDIVANPIFAPVMSFDKLTVVERLEIEGFRSIYNLLRTYLEQSTRTQMSYPPVSVAVFGPPGSGKSFVVKQIASEINSTYSKYRLEPVEYNVAQFRSVEELGDAITRASVINNEGKIPLVFFDEFDCDFGGNSLGWLKYFLAPMQDGMFYGVRQTIKIARAIFVFAGGIHSTFEAFDPASSLRAARDRQDFEEAEKRLKIFRDQKGPDFISRLRGHINIMPLDVAHGMVKPIIRRSIILRGLLEKRGLVIKGRLGEIAYIDEDIVYALLTIDQYRHGARSMEAVIQMCTPIQNKIEKASLPSRAQLNMHVDADEFFLRMYRSRFRPAPEVLGSAPTPAVTAARPAPEQSEVDQIICRGDAVEQKGREVVGGRSDAEEPRAAESA